MFESFMAVPLHFTIEFLGFLDPESLRRELRRALTPQCFRYELLRKAYEQVDVNDPSLTDESVLVEKIGTRVSIVEGSSRNIKITTPQDLLIAEALLKG